MIYKKIIYCAVLCFSGMQGAAKKDDVPTSPASFTDYATSYDQLDGRPSVLVWQKTKDSKGKTHIKLIEKPVYFSVPQQSIRQQAKGRDLHFAKTQCLIDFASQITDPKNIYLYYQAIAWAERKNGNKS